MNIGEIRDLAHAQNIKWTTHVVERFQERGIQPSDVEACIFNGEIIEDYPSSYPHPACLVSGASRKGAPIHVVVGIGKGFLWVVTAYFPAEDQWSDGFKSRRR